MEGGREREGEREKTQLSALPVFSVVLASISQPSLELGSGPFHSIRQSYQDAQKLFGQTGGPALCPGPQDLDSIRCADGFFHVETLMSGLPGLASSGHSHSKHWSVHGLSSLS